MTEFYDTMPPMIPETYAEIHAHVETIRPMGRRVVTYEWVGSHKLPVRISGSLPIDDLPFHLIRIDYDYLNDYVVYVRKDSYFPFGFVLHARVKIKNYLWVIFNRFMITLNVWNLAYTPNGFVPSWRDIFRKRKG